jgi:GNAT superfamily N-acetyltransferase
MSALFETAGLVVRELRRDELPALQALFDANPDYFIAVGGQPPLPDEAEREFDELPPPPLSFGTRWFAGVFDRAGALSGLLILLSDLTAKDVWHTALFFLAGAQRGTGAAAELQAALERWARAGGARWLRLGVVKGNARAERFWARCGYREVRTREITNASGVVKTVGVLVKRLAGGSLDDYLREVPRDRPGSTLP